jgi:hypothetical protein
MEYEIWGFATRITAKPQISLSSLRPPALFFLQSGAGLEMEGTTTFRWRVSYNINQTLNKRFLGLNDGLILFEHEGHKKL